MERHVKTLGVLFIVYGIMGLIGMAVVLGVFALGITGPPYRGAEILPLTLGVMIAGIIAVFHLPAIVVGWALLQRYSWARIPALIVGVMNLTSLPFGTALGIYGLWVLLKEETTQFLAGASTRSTM